MGITAAKVHLRRKGPWRDQRALGGFYEAILSLMVVTLGVVLLTASLAFLAADNASSGPELDVEAREIMDVLLSDRALFNGERMADISGLVRLPDRAPFSDAPVSVRIMITEVNGGTEILYQRSEPEDIRERASLSEPVNVRHSAGDVRAASLTVWVWL